MSKWFEDKTPLWMKKEMKERIKKLGRKGETYDIILNRIVSLSEEKIRKEQNGDEMK